MRRAARVAALVGLAGCATPRGGRAVVEQLESELRASQLRVSQCEERADRCADDAAPTAIYRELSAAFRDGEVAVMRDGPRSALVIPADLLFGGDGLRVRAEAEMVLDLLGTALKLHPEVRARVTVHTDAVAPPAAARQVEGDLLALTTAQARVLVGRLRDAYGVPARQLVAAGQGATAPVAPGETPLEQARNRRVVVALAVSEPWDRPGVGAD